MTTETFDRTAIHRFADRAWDEFLELSPVWATVQGIETWDDRLDDPTAEGRAVMMAPVSYTHLTLPTTSP